MRDIAVITPVAPGPHRTYVKEAIASSEDFPCHVLALDGPWRIPVRNPDPDRVAIVEAPQAVGRSEARNLALAWARDHGFRWSLFLDADDLLLPTAWQDLQEAPEAHIYYGESNLSRGGETYNHLVMNSHVRAQLIESPPRVKFVLANVSMLCLTERACRIRFDPDITQGEHFDFFMRYIVNPEIKGHKLSRPIVCIRSELSTRLYGPWGADRPRYEEWIKEPV